MMEGYNLASYYDLNMQEVDMKDLITIDVRVPSIPFNHIWGGGSDSIYPIHYGTDIRQREIVVTIHIDDYDYIDFQLLKNKLYERIVPWKPYYLVDKRERGKRYRVISNGSIYPRRLDGVVDVPFITQELPYAESIGTTKIIDERGTLSDDELWGFGMGLIDDPDSRIYTHTGTTFKVFNAGNVPIHPFEQELKITINNVQGSSDHFQLENITNGSLFRVTEAVNSNQQIILDGPNVTSNGLTFLRKTNKQFIELNPGWNEFKITGATSATVSFDFRFYYE